MDLLKIVTSQYNASLEMFEDAVTHCPESLWQEPNYKNRFWHIAFHTMFWTHMYLNDSEHTFEKWEKHIKDYQWLNFRSKNYGEEDVIYSKEDVLSYLNFCKTCMAEHLPTLNFEDTGGFSWLPVTKLELHIYNIRHIQHHTSQLTDRLKEVENTPIKWVGHSKTSLSEHDCLAQ